MANSKIIGLKREREMGNDYSEFGLSIYRVLAYLRLTEMDH